MYEDGNFIPGRSHFRSLSFPVVFVPGRCHVFVNSRVRCTLTRFAVVENPGRFQSRSLSVPVVVIPGRFYSRSFSFPVVVIP